MLDASLDPRDVQTAARHTDPRTTMRYDPVRKNLDCIPPAYIANAGDDCDHTLAILFDFVRLQRQHSV